jgi:predicted  nucleic acid-binding Zn-ribbon protein
MKPSFGPVSPPTTTKFRGVLVTSNGSRYFSWLALPLVASQALSTTAFAQMSVTDLAAPAPASLAATIATAETAATTAVPPISASKDWRLLDLGQSCVAETVATLDGVNHHLEVRIDKTAVSFPLELTIRSEVASSPIIGFSGAIDAAKKKTYVFAKLSGAGTEETFWNVPRGSEELVSYLKREMKYDVQVSDAAGATGKTVSFSLRGSSLILTDLGKKCASGLNVPTAAYMAFEKAFLPVSVSTIDLARVTPAKADALRTLLASARDSFMTSTTIQSDIEKLNAKYLRDINELAGLRSNIDRLTQKEVTRLEAARTAAQTAIATADLEIQNLKSQSAPTEAALIQANTDYEAAYNAVKPLLPEYNRLSANISANQQRETDARNRLSGVESTLAQANADLRRLQQESNNLRSNYQSAQAEAQNARNELQRAAQAARGFDAQAELRRRLSSDSRISNLEREVQNAEQRINAQERAVTQAEAERNRMNSDLQQCKATPGKDCSNEQRRLVDAQRRFSEARQAVQALQQTRDQKRQELANVRQQIQREVQQTQNDLNRREQEARSRTQASELNLRDIEARMRSVDQVEIPSRQNDIARLNTDRSIAAQDVSNSASRTANSRTDLANWRQSSGFDSLKSDADRKLATVNRLKADLTRIDTEIRKREKIIADSNRSLAQIAIDMEKTLATIKAKESRSVEVQKALEPYELAKADLATRKAAADQTFTAAQIDFNANL